MIRGPCFGGAFFAWEISQKSLEKGLTLRRVGCIIKAPDEERASKIEEGTKMASVYNLKCEDTTYTILGKTYPGTKWSWTFEKEDPRFLYSTNDLGEGIFCYDSKKGERTQIAGTCQFSACKTTSGMRRKIEKFFDWMWMENGSTEAE